MTSDGTEHSPEIRSWAKGPGKEWHATVERTEDCYKTVCGDEILLRTVVWAESDREQISDDDDVCPQCAQYVGTDIEHAEKALDELQTFIRRQDVPPGLSTLDKNLKAAERHLEAICDE